MVNSATVLLVEGENSQFKELTPIIEKFKMGHHSVKTCEEAQEFVNRETPNLILMDLLIDRMDAIDLMSAIKGFDTVSESTMVVFSDRNENYVEITALNAGADDFLIKPVNKRVFESRLNAWIRQLNARANRVNKKELGDISLDDEKFTAQVKEKEVILQRKEFEIISLLLSRPKKVFSRDEIKESIWLNAQNVRNRTIDVHIRNLRSKLGNKYIKTYKGIGYSYDG